jgi:hypothetical protein
VEEITQLRQRAVEEEEERKKGEQRDKENESAEQDTKMDGDDGEDATAANGDFSGEKKPVKTEKEPSQENGARMDVDDEGAVSALQEEEVQKPASPQKMVQPSAADEDDAVEY